MNTKPLFLGMAIAVFLSGCATTAPKLANQTNAKDMLMDTAKNQLKSSFGYQTHVYVAKPTLQEATADNVAPTCQEMHDQTYIELAKFLKEQGEALAQTTNPRYLSALAQIRHDYETCVEQAMQDSYQPLDFQEVYKKSGGDTAKMAQIVADLAQTQANNAKPTTEPSNSLQAKKSALIDEYLLTPTTISMTGHYQPMAGTFTALPSVAYDSKNLQLGINQPIHVDLKTGKLYLWADNFAMINGLALDKSLGEQWHNKWLYLPLNDGSLPESFAKDFIKAYIYAKQESLLSLSDAHLKYANAEQVLALPQLSTHLSDAEKTAIRQSTHIVQNIAPKDMQAYANYLFADTLYDEITTKYPDITKANGDDKFNSRQMVQILLMGLGRQINEFFQQLPQLKNSDNSTATVSHYGISQGKMSWLHHRYHLGKQLSNHALQTDATMIDVFTTITPNARHDFDRLPANVRTPNPSNSINLLDYVHVFSKKLESGDIRFQFQLPLGTPSEQQDY